MSEMLGNQYFMARNFNSAEVEFEPCLLENPGNKGLKRKLIVCYTQTGKIKKALELFESLIKEDIEFVIEADEVKDDCPCPELIAKLEKSESIAYKSLDFYIMCGIIWLYCDIQKSYECFLNAQKFDEEHKLINSVIKIITEYQNKS